ncbi:MAG: tyrosine--tRNA ligase [Firmicutes bacterium]|nr:tyrosine--tRNA ligase [Bacillota bacterium]MDD4263993.1 tyrosine--tRNA ligase [Bacillota bacterium]MDD4693510.1 tyrosine--tRNA ligase [Bacillota bacterium]
MLTAKEQLELLERGTAQIISKDELLKKLEKSVASGTPLRVKLGVDPTSSDIHLGHTVPLQKLRQFQDLGHTAVLIIGDYTAMIGDPSGKSSTRPRLSHEEVLANAKTYQEQVFKILIPEQTEVLFNGDWFSKMTFADVATMTSKLTVARMLERDDFAKRYCNHQPISILEFIYPLMQATDSVEIKADVELGGTDQIFNILLGRDLQKDAGLESQVVMCLPLLVGLDGVNKMSKSLGNYVGITDEPNDMYGKIMSLADDLMITYFELVTNLEKAEIDAIKKGLNDGTLHPKKVKSKLGLQVVTQYHGQDAALTARDEFENVFKAGGLPEDIPEFTINDDRVWIVKLLVDLDLVKSNSDGRRMIEQGAVKLNNEKVEDCNLEVEITDGMVLQVGKRKFARVKK